MIDTQQFITDAQLLGAFNTGHLHVDENVFVLAADSCRRVAEFAIAAYINATLPEKLEQLDRVTAAVERYTGEVLK